VSLAWRLGIAVVLVAGATLFVVSLRVDPTQAVEEPVGDDPKTAVAEVPGVSDAPPAKPGVLDSHENCKGCHTEIYNEWLEDHHSQAWVGPIYTDLSKNHSDPNCWSCHAPRPILETGLSSPAEARADRRESGVNCLTCHLNRERTHVLGPIENPDAGDCGPKYDPTFPNDAAQKEVIDHCGVCHNLHGTHKEFLGSKYAREGKTCLSCHMDEVLGPIVNGGKPRVRRSHRMPGGHSREMLRKAMTVHVRIKDGKVVARVINRGAGHRIPTDARHRAIFLRVAFLDAYGQPVASVGMDGSSGREVSIDLIRLFYRWEQREPTQIDPEGTLGKDPWRESSIDIPGPARGGHVVVRLYYLARWDWPVRNGILVEEKKVPLDD